MKTMLMSLFAALFAISAASSFAATTEKAAQGTIVVAEDDSGNTQAAPTSEQAPSHEDSNDK